MKRAWTIPAGWKQASVNVHVLKRRDGWSEFTCTGCGSHVHKAGDDGDRRPICAICRWIEEQKLAPPEERRLRDYLRLP